MPTTDAWATLAGIARETKRITLGALVSPVTFRLPGNFAKLVTTVSEMSGGRVEVGLGAGWNDAGARAARHSATRHDRKRFDMLEEQLAILHGLWTEPDGWSYEGKHWTVRDARFYPKPLAPAGRRHPNIIVGGGGGPRMAASRRALRGRDEHQLQGPVGGGRGVRPARRCVPEGRPRPSSKSRGRS